MSDSNDDKKTEKVVELAIERMKRGKVKKPSQRPRMIYFTIVLAVIGFLYAIQNENGVAPTLRDAQLPKSENNSQTGQTTVTLFADSQGHFEFSGMINDKQVLFFYDTGASNVAIPEKIANYLGLIRGQSFYAMTANGRTLAYQTVLETVQVGDIRLENIDASITTGLETDTILLGMSFLKHVEIKQDSQTLRLTHTP